MQTKPINLAGERSKYFLATTALEEFWDTSKPIVFLGGWCKRYSRKLSQQYIETETLPLPCDDDETAEIFNYLNGLYERILPELTLGLNDIHDVSHSTRYWRMFIGPWLLHYIHALYDRYLTIQMAIKRYPDFTTICLDESCFIVPTDTMHFIEGMKTDIYNIQIYSKILCELGNTFPTKKTKKNNLPSEICQNNSRNALHNLATKFCKLLVRKMQNNKQVLVYNSYLPFSAQLELIVKTKGRLWPCDSGYSTIKHFDINYEARTHLSKTNFGSNEFEKLLVNLIASDMPQSMMEGFQTYRKNVFSNYLHKPKAIMSATSWHYDDMFKMWAAESAEYGSTMLGIQHGGNYGSAAYFIQENHELNIVDKFYSWGWSRSGCRATITPLPSAKLVKIKKIPLREDKVDLLFITSIWSRYLIQYPFTNEYWTDYFSQQAVFLKNMPDELKKYIKVRPHREDLGWDVILRLKDLIPEIRIEGWNIPFWDSLKKCRILICDHPLNSTTFIESLKSNKPTVLFYNPNFAANYIRAESVHLYDKLKEADILFDNPVDAAKHLDMVYDDVKNWWEEPQRQAIVNEFIERFAKTTAGWAKEWNTELNSVLSKSFIDN